MEDWGVESAVCQRKYPPATVCRYCSFGRLLAGVELCQDTLVRANIHVMVKPTTREIRLEGNSKLRYRESALDTWDEKGRASLEGPILGP